MSSPLDATSVQPWVPNEFVVALPHLAVVMSELRDLPQPVQIECEVSELLDLALITIHNVDYVAEQINVQFGQGERCECRSEDRPEYGIDRVTRAIREKCRRDYGGWVPTIGKNRTLDGVHTTQHVGIGGAGYPTCPDDLRIGDVSSSGAGDRVTVGILDTTLWGHPQLKGRYLGDEPGIHLDTAEWQWHTAGHATFVAGMVLQNSPNVDLRVRCVLSPADGTALAWQVANEMVRLARVVDVLNVSFACFTDDDEEPLVLARAIELIDSETVIVAAAGNHGNVEPRPDRRTPNSPKSPMWPAASSRVIAVGAHDRNGEPAYFSPKVPWVNLTAPGENVDSLYLEGAVKFQEHDGVPPPAETTFDGFARWTGTSFAAAAVSGAIARRIRPGRTARQALGEVRNLPPGNPEGIWAHRLPGGDGQ